MSEAQQHSMDFVATHEKLVKVKDTINKMVFEREDETDGILLGILSGQNTLFFGEVGTAKTYQLQVASSLLGLTDFDILLSETVKPDQIFGPTDIPALADGIQRTKYKDYAPGCEVLFFDEIFKANAVVLNPLLWLINEHKYRDGDNGIVNCPTKAVFGASNELPQDDGLKAIYDRFLLRYRVSYLKDDNSTRKMIESYVGGSTKSDPIMTREEVEFLISKTKEVVVPKQVIDTAISMRRSLERGALNESISDRRFLNAIKLVQASAILAGRMEATIQDLEVFASIFWNKPEQIHKVQSFVYAKSSADASVLSTYLEKALEIKNELNNGGDLSEHVKALKKLWRTTSTFKSRYANQVSLEIKSIGMLFLSLIKDRKVFRVVKTDMEDAIKVNAATASVWTYKEMKSMGFRYRRRAQYWHYDNSLKHLSKMLKKKGIKLVVQDMTSGE